MSIVCSAARTIAGNKLLIFNPKFLIFVSPPFLLNYLDYT